MSDEQNINLNSDDEDLESLRLAALKTINAKNEPSPSKSFVKLHSNNKHRLRNDIVTVNNSEQDFSNASYLSHPQPVLPPYKMNPDLNGMPPMAQAPFYCQPKPFPQQTVRNIGIYGANVVPYGPVQHLRPVVHTGPALINPMTRPQGPVRAWLPPEQNISNSNIYDVHKTISTYTSKLTVQDTHMTDVQLSPRSLAFVAQNNGILARRKIEADLSPKKLYRRSKSPSYRRISRSPSPHYRQSPGRWSSVSPPPSRLPRFSKSKSKSPVRRSRSKPPQYYKKSRSRSSSGSGPARRLNERRRRGFSKTPDYRPSSPSHHNRNLSRSPIPSGKTVNIIKRNRSRSPLQRRYSPAQHIQHRRSSRSRSPRRNYVEHRRSRSPQTIKRRLSPLNVNKRNDRRPLDRKSPLKRNRKSPVPIRDSPSKNKSYQRRFPRKSLSPQTRKRSRTPKSPVNTSNKNLFRRSKDRQTTSSSTNPNNIKNGSTNTAKKSPVNNFKNKTDEIHNSSLNSQYNHNSKNKTDSETKLSKSPLTRKRRSRSKTIEQVTQKEENVKESDKKSNEKAKKTNQILLEEQSNKISSTCGKTKTCLDKTTQKVQKDTSKMKAEQTKIDVVPPEENFESLTPPIEKDLDDAKLIEEIDTVLGDNKSNTTDDEDDGIDLFASEESESENEGRFKSSNKTERNSNVQAMSFTKLKEGATSSANVRNLQDIVNEDKYEDKQNKSKRDYFKKYSRNVKSDSRRRDDHSSSKRRSPSYNNDKNSSDSYNKSKFKQTFQVIKSEGSRIQSKPSPRNSLRSTPERNVKKRSKDNMTSEKIDKKASYYEKSNTPPRLTDELVKGVTRRRSRSKLKLVEGQRNGNKADISNERKKSSILSISNKKTPIHSRLGAMTNTFEAPTKSSTWKDSSSYNDQEPKLSIHYEHSHFI